MQLVEQVFLSTAIAPSVDLYNGDPASDVYNMAKYNRIAFLVLHGAGATGTALFTVEACSDISGSDAEAVAFKFSEGDAAGVLTAQQDATAAGFTSTAGANQIFVIEVEDTQLVEGKPFVRLQATEVADDPVVGSVSAHLTPFAYAGAIMPDATV